MELSHSRLDQYLASIGKDRGELSGVRVKDVARREAVTFELDFTNEWGITYTRVARAWVDSNCNLKFKSITSKTRLHVPIKEVPVGAKVYLPHGSGPYSFTKDPDGIYAIFAPEAREVETFLSDDQCVSIEFYYVRGVGMIAGGAEMAAACDIIPWAAKNVPWVESGKRIEHLVNGCKFSLWAACCALRGIVSVFDLPTEGE